MSALANAIGAGFLRLVAKVESSPRMTRFFETLFRLFPWYERLVLGAIKDVRGAPPAALILRDGSTFYLPADDREIRRWQELLENDVAGK